MLEDAVTAGWLTVYPQNFPALVKKGVDERRKLFQDLMKRDDFREWAAPMHAASQAMLDEDLADAGGFVLDQRMNALEGTDGLYSHYRLLTRHSHAGMASLTSTSRTTTLHRWAWASAASERYRKQAARSASLPPCSRPPSSPGIARVSTGSGRRS